MKIFFVLFFSIALLAIRPLHAMSMAPMPMLMQDEDGLALALELDRKIKIERKRSEERRTRRALREREDHLVSNLLASHADLNADVDSRGKPLEIVCRFKSITTLLRHGADPKQCQRSPLLRPLFYYIKRTGRDDAVDWYYVSPWQQEEISRASVSRLIKLSTCWKFLLRAGANTNQEMQGMLPLPSVFFLDRNDYCKHINMHYVLKLLIWHGADLGKRETQSGRDAYSYIRCPSPFRHLSHIKQERQKYEAVCQILRGYKEEDSPLSWLPLEMIHKIIGYVIQGEFSPPRRRALPSSPLSAVTNTSRDQSEEIPSHLPVSSSVSVPAQSVRWRSMMGTKLFVVATASGIGYWAYKKWQQRKKAKEKRMQELWDAYYRQRSWRAESLINNSIGG